MIRLCQKKCGTPIKAILIGVNSGKPEDFRVLSDKPIWTLHRFRTVCLHCIQRCIYIYNTVQFSWGYLSGEAIGW